MPKNKVFGQAEGGVPAKVIGKFEDLAEKRFIQCQNRPCHLSSKEEIDNYFWKD